MSKWLRLLVGLLVASIIGGVLYYLLGHVPYIYIGITIFVIIKFVFDKRLDYEKNG